MSACSPIQESTTVQSTARCARASICKRVASPAAGGFRTRRLLAGVRIADRQALVICGSERDQSRTTLADSLLRGARIGRCQESPEAARGPPGRPECWRGCQGHHGSSCTACWQAVNRRAAVEMLRVARVTRSAGTQVTMLRWSDRTRTRALLVAGSQLQPADGSSAYASSKTRQRRQLEQSVGVRAAYNTDPAQWRSRDRFMHFEISTSTRTAGNQRRFVASA
jgi:hypothetical protein